MRRFEEGKRQKKYVVTELNMASMSELSASQVEALHDEVVRKAGETIFKKYKVVMNIMGKNVASIANVYPDLLAYDVYSVKPFLASDTPTLISDVEVGAEITDELVAKWLQLQSLEVDRIVLILPEKTRSKAEDTLKKLGPKFELHFFDKDLRIS
ncbi:MAG: hypothetical protein ABSB21_02270 [Halobacteriota archaeon]